MNAAPDPSNHPREFLRALHDAAVAPALPAHNSARFLPAPPKGRTLVLGAGKAGGAMAQAVDALWPKAAPLSGLVVTRYAHVPPAYKQAPGRIEVVEASHPVPDAAGERAAQRILELTQGLTADDLVLCLVSGGASALLSLPADGLSLEDKRAINMALLNSGAAIDEMNCVRKHLSAIKGGRLAARCAPARVVTLLISDVPGDAPEVIGSGPTVADPSTCADALRILQRYAIDIPSAARAGLDSGAFETPKPGDARFAGHQLHMIATPQQSLEAAAARARTGGPGRTHPQRSDRRRVTRGGQGACRAGACGRAARRALRAALRHPQRWRDHGDRQIDGRPRWPCRRVPAWLRPLALQGEPGVHVLAADTDGIDGIEDNAGAIVTPDTLVRAAAAGLKAGEYLDRNDAYSFFSAVGDLVVPGPTFTNVNDFRALLVI